MTSNSIKAECNGLSSFLFSVCVYFAIAVVCSGGGDDDELFEWQFCYMSFSAGYKICAICFIASLKIYGEIPLNALPTEFMFSESFAEAASANGGNDSKYDLSDYSRGKDI